MSNSAAEGGNGITELKHEPSGASCQIHAFGATLLSYKDGQQRELLFVSRDAKLDGTKAVRGGIPLVFPIFGPPPPPAEPSQEPPSTMPQHGFARNNWWTLGPIVHTENASSVSYHLDLDQVTEARGSNNPWETNDLYNVRLELTVTISGDSLTTVLQVQNTGVTDFAFQALFHTYYAVSGHAALNSQECFVRGLQGYSAYDQVGKCNTLVGSDPITVAGELDSIHTPPSDCPTASVEIGVGGGRTVSLTCVGTVNGVATPISVVVWNPHVEKAASMNDFGDDQYLDMICVEPGLLSRPLLSSGAVAVLKQIIRV